MNASRSKAAGSSPADRYIQEKNKYRDLLWIFFMSSFCGCLLETVFCRFSIGSWLNRSSLVFGHFSCVWGLGIALCTIFLGHCRNRSVAFLFFAGTLLGAVFEYICSLVTEAAFGKVFWDYSEHLLNIGGRVNLAFSFGWGVSAALWIKVIYPQACRFVTFLTNKFGSWLSFAVLLFLIVDLTVTCMALVRYNNRGYRPEPATATEEWLDKEFPDSVMGTIYPMARDPKELKD